VTKLIWVDQEFNLNTRRTTSLSPGSRLSNAFNLNIDLVLTAYGP